MSALLAHAKAARIMGDAFGTEAGECGNEAHALLLARLSRAYLRASSDMMVVIIAEAAAMDAPCSLSHDVGKGTKCPGCGVVR